MNVTPAKIFIQYAEHHHQCVIVVSLHEHHPMADDEKKKKAAVQHSDGRQGKSGTLDPVR